MNTIDIAHLFTNVSIKEIVQRNFVTFCVFGKQTHPVAKTAFTNVELFLVIHR
jgi:hypothetical protein